MTVQVKVTSSPGQTNPPSSTEEVKITQPVTVHRSENIIIPTMASAMYPVDNLKLISEILLAILRDVLYMYILRLVLYEQNMQLNNIIVLPVSRVQT